MALSNLAIKRLPFSPAIIYLSTGIAVGAAAIFPISISGSSVLIERITEAALLISLFTAGLKLQFSVGDPRWRISVRLAIAALLVAIAGVAGIAVLLGAPLGLAIIMGAVLAPTDPLLASEVQVEDEQDRDLLRFALTAESGLNDALAFPFVVLGIALLSESQPFDLLSWLGIQVVWYLIAGAVIGILLGWGIGRYVLYLRTAHKSALGLDEFLLLGLIALTFGISALLSASTFLAVFVAGLSFRHAARTGEASTAQTQKPDIGKQSMSDTNSAHAGTLMTRSVLRFNQQLENVAEAIVVTIAGVLIPLVNLSKLFFLAPLLLLFIRPLSVLLSISSSSTTRRQRRLLGWFGIRGIGSIYYLFYAINHGLPSQHVILVLSITLFCVALSIVIHGISATPLMRHYRRHGSRKPPS